LELSASLYINLNNSVLEDLLINTYDKKLDNTKDSNEFKLVNEDYNDYNINNEFIPLSSSQYEEHEDKLDAFGYLDINENNDNIQNLSRGITFSPMKNSKNNSSKNILNESRSQTLQRLMKESDEIFNSFDSTPNIDNTNNNDEPNNCDSILDFTKLNLQSKNPKRQLINFRRSRNIAKLSGNKYYYLLLLLLLTFIIIIIKTLLIRYVGH
jgi:hypothetical protein